MRNNIEPILIFLFENNLILFANSVPKFFLLLHHFFISFETWIFLICFRNAPGSL